MTEALAIGTIIGMSILRVLSSLATLLYLYMFCWYPEIL